MYGRGHIVLPSSRSYLVFAYFYGVICKRVAVVFKHWVVSSMLPMALTVNRAAAGQWQLVWAVVINWL